MTELPGSAWLQWKPTTLSATPGCLSRTCLADAAGPVSCGSQMLEHFIFCCCNFGSHESQSICSHQVIVMVLTYSQLLTLSHVHA